MLLLFAAAILQVTLVASGGIAGGSFDLLLVVLVAVALARGSVVGALGGFGGGLVVDTATLGTLGLTSLLLTIVGYWIGRYGETTGRDRAHAPYLSVVVATILYAAGAFGLHALLGNDVSARLVLLDWLPPSVVLNLVLALPVFWLARRVLAPSGATRAPRAEVRTAG